MALIKVRLGNLITQRREKYDTKESLPTKGVSRDGFIEVKQKDADLKMYNVFYRNDFIFNPARMEVNSIVFNNLYNKGICSSLYEVFYINDTDTLLPEYLNLYVKRDEFARRCSYIGWGSAREYCRVASISEIEIDLPPIDIQRKYVNIYKSMLESENSLRTCLDDLKMVFDSMIDKYKKYSRRIGFKDVFEEIDKRNTEGISDVRGLNINKEFMPTVADISDKKLDKYKVVEKGQFAFSGMQTGRDKCIRISLFEEEKPVVISPAYTVFRVKNKDVLPEYLMMWFLRPETDRLGWFNSDSSIRSNLDMDRFYEMSIPAPSIEEQKALIELYSAYSLRKAISEEMRKKINKLCPILIRGAVKEAERY